LYVSEHSPGLVSKKRRGRGVDNVTAHGSVRPSGSVRVFRAILAADVRPSDEVCTFLADVGDPDRDPATEPRSTPTEYSSVCGGRIAGSSCRLRLGSTIEMILV
jgi:hypothetical protein